LNGCSPILASCYAQDEDVVADNIELDLGASREGSRTGKLVLTQVVIKNST
jgi:hypothetical protein